MTLSITFKLGTNLDTAQVLVQNRVAIAIPVLPPDVQRIGVTTKKQSPDITLVVHPGAPDGSLDSLSTSNYALLQLRDELARVDGVGDINVFGAREYSMRLWLDPNKLSSRGLTAQDVVTAIQEQNVQVAAGIIGAPPVPKGATAFQYTVSTQGRLTDEKQFGDIIVKTGTNGQVTRVRDIARVELAARDYTVNSQLGGKPATAIAIYQLPGSNALATSDAVRKKMAELKQRFPTGLVLSSVFIPPAFISGTTGTFFRQFALTIAVSTAISALNSLTLSPALAALLLRPRGAEKDSFQRLLDGLLGWLFKGFNRTFAWSSNAYGNTIARLVRLAVIILFIYAGLLGLTGLGFKVVPGGFLPTQDRGYAVVFAQLPAAASFDRTQAVVDKISKIAPETLGVLNTVEFAGFNLFGGNQPNTAAVFLPFKEFSERNTREQGMPAILAKINARVRAEIPEALVIAFPPPPVAGIGNAGGYKLFIQDRGNAGLDELQTQAFAMMVKANQAPGLANNLTTFRANVPQLWLDVDRVKAKSMNVPLSNIFGTLQTYLGSTYVNDLTLFGRTYRVTAQADSQFRLSPDDIRLLKTRNNSGGIVPLGSVATVQEVSGADKITRYNMFTAADLSGQPAPGASTGDALAAVERIAKQILPSSFTTEWTEIALQQTLAGNSAIYIFPLCVLFVFLLLSALYESWSLPLAIILIVPMCLFSSIYGVWLRSMENNIFTQIGFIVLVGLACKNAILIVEFPNAIQDSDKQDRFTAAVEAGRLRLRPILMTSFAFIFGVLPLVLSSGAGAEMRQALGTAVSFGMLGVTGFGLFLTPVFYVVIMWFTERRTKTFSRVEPSPPLLVEGSVHT